MKRPEVKAKLSGDNNWRRRPSHAARAAEYAKEQSIARTGAGNPRWGGGRIVARHGYIKKSIGGSKYDFEHRCVMEEHLGRPLREDEIIHHINRDRQDNRIENLQIVNRSEHVAYHNREYAKRGGNRRAKR